MSWETPAFPDFVTGWGSRIVEVGKTYLYVIESGSMPGRIKIGIASDPLKRLSAIDISRYSLPSPYDIKHLFLLEEAHQIEKYAQLYLWKQGQWYWGELFDCPHEEAAAVVRAILTRQETFRKPRKIEDAIAILKEIRVSEETTHAYDVPRSDAIFEKAAQRYARSAAKKVKLVDEGFSGFYGIEKHRAWYLE